MEYKQNIYNYVVTEIMIIMITNILSDQRVTCIQDDLSKEGSYVFIYISL